MTRVWVLGLSLGTVLRCLVEGIMRGITFTVDSSLWGQRGYLEFLDLCWNVWACVFRCRSQHIRRISNCKSLRLSARKSVNIDLEMEHLCENVMIRHK